MKPCILRPDWCAPQLSTDALTTRRVGATATGRVGYLLAPPAQTFQRLHAQLLYGCGRAGAGVVKDEQAKVPQSRLAGTQQARLCGADAARRVDDELPVASLAPRAAQRHELLRCSEDDCARRGHGQRGDEVDGGDVKLQQAFGQRTQPGQVPGKCSHSKYGHSK